MAMLNLADKCVVVTGGAGFLGHYVIKGLQNRGCRRIQVPRIEQYDLVNLDGIERMYEDMRPSWAGSGPIARGRASFSTRI